MVNLTLFSQIVGQLDRRIFTKLVKEKDTDKYSKGFSSWDHLVSMLFCHFAKSQSLRDIGNGLRSATGNLNHLGVGKAPSKSNLSYQNKERDWTLFESYYYKLLDHLGQQAKFKQVKFRIKSKIYLLDASTISLCLSLFDWAKYKTAKGAVKLHTLLDYDSNLPAYVNITDGKTADNRGAWDIPLKKGSVIVADRFYNDFNLLNIWDSKQVFFVVRHKTNLKYRIVKELDLPDNRHQHILKDEIIKLANDKYSKKLRRVAVWNDEKKMTIELITNQMTWTANTISELYKSRWQIEIFFREIKQLLTHYYSTVILYLWFMEKEDFRRVEESGRLAVRRRAIRMIKSGVLKKEVARVMGVRPSTVTDWYKAYSKSGYDGLKSKKPGVKSEDAKLLSTAQEQAIQHMIVDKMPDQLKLNFSLWTRQAVKELVERELGVVLAISTMGVYLRKWGFTPQKPKQRAYEQNPKLVQKWLEESYPAIKAQAKEEKAEIHWADETGVRNACHHGRSYAPKGKTPTKLSMSQHFNVNMISSVTNQGKVQFMIYTDSMNADRLIQFMQQLIKSSSCKVFLILDNLKVHHSKLVKQWVVEHKKEIELFFLPSYSPERNPDEYLNCDLKQGLSIKPSPKNQAKLKSNMEDHMNLLCQSPERVMKYFKHDSIKYAS